MEPYDIVLNEIINEKVARLKKVNERIATLEEERDNLEAQIDPLRQLAVRLVDDSRELELVKR